MVEYKQESSEFIRYQYSYGKVGDTLPCTLCMNIQWYAGVRPSPGEATGWRGRSNQRHHAPSGLSDPAGGRLGEVGAWGWGIRCEPGLMF